MFGDHRRECLGDGFPVDNRVGGAFLFLAQHILPRRFRSGAVGEIAVMLVHPPAIAAQALGDMLGGIIEGRVGIGRFALATQLQAAARMHIDITGKETSRPAERDKRLQRAVEILARDQVQLRADTRAQCVGQFDLFAGNRNLHVASPRNVEAVSVTAISSPSPDLNPGSCNRHPIRPVPTSPACAARNWGCAAHPGIWPRSGGLCLCLPCAAPARSHRRTIWCRPARHPPAA